ncbi:hypothetical protein ACQP1S_14000 [Micromonospora matsumotoense]
MIRYRATSDRDPRAASRIALDSVTLVTLATLESRSNEVPIG